MVDEIDLGRRAFFRRAAGKAAEKVVEEADARIEARAARWIRPPWARAELEFLLACTRCSACIEACPHKLIFPLPASYGVDVAATPALDILNNACHLCEDWPCVATCEPQALRLEVVEDEAEIQPPKLAIASIDTALCLPYQGPECGACEGSCPVEGALTWSQEKPSINSAVCVGCGLCRAVCIAEPKAVLIRSLYAIEQGDLT